MLCQVAQSRGYTVTTATGTRAQTHTYPSVGECQKCHNPTAVFVLGPKTAQFNGPLSYPNGVEDNQLRAWNHVELFNPVLNEATIDGYERMYAIDDTSVSPEMRARSYLDSNCSYCHRPGGAPARRLMLAMRHRWKIRISSGPSPVMLRVLQVMSMSSILVTCHALCYTNA